MTGIIRVQRRYVWESIYTIKTARDFRWFRGIIRDYDRQGMVAFGLILTGLRVIYVDASGSLTQQGEILAGVTEDMIR